MFRGLLKLSFPLLVIPSFLIVMAVAVGIVLLAVDLVWSREHRLAWAMIELIATRWRGVLAIVGASALWLVATVRVAIGIFAPSVPGAPGRGILPDGAQGDEAAFSGTRI